MSKDQPSTPPQISPYLFPLLLAGFGIWCFYDGWLSTAPGMQEHLLFNRIGSAVLLPWSIIDFYRTRKFEKQEQTAQQSEQSD
ncbi:hypothetical protein HGB07_06550, partial [Candidatus Roizmanbacteria bacterium]|nr:hypothetical protein [Candidatus Roizmanbacteria bacterium]